MNRSGKPEADDRSVIGAVLDGDVDAFEILMRRYERYAFSVVGRHVPAEAVPEVAQDVFVRAYQGLGGFAGGGDFKKWLAGIAVRACHDYWRRRYRRREMPLSELTDAHRQWLEDSASAASVAAFDAAETAGAAAEVLQWAMAGLPPADRMVLELMYFEERSVSETAELLGWSTANVKVRAFRARRKLKKRLSSAVDKGGKDTDEQA